MAEWIVPCNPKIYSVFAAFESLETVDWRQSAKSIETGDTIWIYIGRPVQAVCFRCRVLETLIPPDMADHSDDGFNLDGSWEPHDACMRLKLDLEIPKDAVTLGRMRETGLKGNLQGPRRVPEELNELFDPFR